MTTGAAERQDPKPDVSALLGLDAGEESVIKREPELNRPSSKFQTCQVVKIKIPKEGEDPGSPVPAESSMGKTGVVQMEGRVYVSDDGEETHLE